MIWLSIGHYNSVKKAGLVMLLLMSSIIACPYCAASDTIGGGLSVYIPLVGIILSPFVMVFGAIVYIRKKDHN
jgi:hypothetical protein